MQSSLPLLARDKVLVDNHSEIAPNKWFSQFLQIANSDMFMAILPVGNDGRGNEGGLEGKGGRRRKGKGRGLEEKLYVTLS